MSARMRGAGGGACYAVWSCAVSALLLTDEPARGQDQSAEQEADSAKAAPPPSAFNLDHLDAYVEVKGEFSSTRVETDSRDAWRGQRSQRNRDWSLEERIGLKLGGAVLDPSLFTFGGDLSFALTQSRFDERIDEFEQTDRDTGHLLLYDLRADFLRGSKVSGSVYALRQDDRINRRFQPTLDQRRTGFGTAWVFSDAKFPMELTYDYLDTDRTGNADRSDDEHLAESTLHYGADWNISKQQRLKLSYEHAENKQDYQGSRHRFDTTRDLLTLEHQLEFGPALEHSLNTLVHWQEESGDLARDFFRAGPQLSLRHSDTLQTLYKYQANRELYEGFDVETHRGDFQLIHQLYSNLTTTFDLFALAEDVDDSVSTDQYGGAVDWQYNRKNPYGRLYANLALAYDTENTSSDYGRRIVLDEAQTFRDPIDVTLRNRNVIPESIIVTDSGGRRVYRLGIDYTMGRLGNEMRLIRIPSGQIADRDTVLIDYEFLTPADGQLDTVRVDFNLEQRFTDGWTPYYRFSYRNQEDEPSSGFPLRADRTDHHRLGAKYETKHYNLGAEFEVFDDTVEPYHGYHLDGLVRIIQSSEHSLNASSRFTQLFFEGGLDDRDVILLDVELDHRWRLSERLSTIERIGYRFEDDSVDGVTHGVEARAGFEYVVGDLSGELTFDYDRLALPNSEEDDYGVYLRVRREFPNVLGVR